MRYTFYSPKSLLDPKTLLTIGTMGMAAPLLFTGAMKGPKTANAAIQTADAAKAAEDKAAEEEARRLRARERLRTGVAASLGKTTVDQFESATGGNVGKKSLLGS